MCALRELQDGTYNIKDLEMMHQILELRSHLASTTNQPDNAHQPTALGSFPASATSTPGIYG